MQSLNNIVNEASLDVPDYHLDHFQSRVLEELHLEFFFAHCRFLITPACRYITTGKADPQEIAQLEGILAQRQELIDELKRYLMYGLTLYSALLETNSYNIAVNDHLVIARFVGLRDKALARLTELAVPVDADGKADYMIGAGGNWQAQSHVIYSGATGDAIRSIGTVLDDQTAEFVIRDIIYSQPEFDERDHIKVEVHNETMLLAGEVSSENKKAKAGRLALDMKTISRVVNELEVMPPADMSDRLHNSYITSKINAKLVGGDPVEGSDTARIKVITAHRTVYLMGTVSRSEGDAVADLARKTGGVDKVVKVFDYTD